MHGLRSYRTAIASDKSLSPDVILGTPMHAQGELMASTPSMALFGNSHARTGRPCVLRVNPRTTKGTPMHAQGDQVKAVRHWF